MKDPATTPAELPPRSLTFLGTGSMGRPMIHKLLDEGWTVHVYDVNKSAAKGVIEAGAVWFNTPREASVGVKIVVSCLPLPIHVHQLLTGPDGAIEGMSPGAVWVDMSTTDYHNTLRIAHLCHERACNAIEAPVSNLSHMGVDFCNASIFCSGDRQGYDDSLPFLNIVGKINFFVGEIGQAQSVKLLTNITFYTYVILFAEITSVVQRADIPPLWFAQQLNSTRGANVMVDQFSPFLFDGSFDDSCTLEIAVKDVSLFCDMADEHNIEIPMARVTHSTYQEASKKYDMMRGHVQVIKITEELNNMPLQISNYSAPSKYGKNKNFVMPTNLVKDAYGREKPLMPEMYNAASFKPTEEQRKIIEALNGYCELIAETITEEAVSVGKSFGVADDYVRKMLIWSVGSSWVADHEGDFIAKPGALSDTAQYFEKSGLKLPLFSMVHDILCARHGWDVKKSL